MCLFVWPERCVNFYFSEQVATLQRLVLLKSHGLSLKNRVFSAKNIDGKVVLSKRKGVILYIFSSSTKSQVYLQPSRVKNMCSFGTEIEGILSNVRHGV